MRTALALLMLFTLAACGGGDEAISQARGAVTAFHQRLEARDYDAILADRAPSLVRSASEAELRAVLYSVNDEVGPMESAEELSVAQQVSSDRRIVSLHYLTHHEDGDVRERFTFEIVDGRPMLAGYTVKTVPRQL